jgi:hypothetical protein
MFGKDSSSAMMGDPARFDARVSVLTLALPLELLLLGFLIGPIDEADPAFPRSLESKLEEVEKREVDSRGDVSEPAGRLVPR